MARRARGFSIAPAVKALQENVARSGPAASASYTLIGAVLLLGWLGHALDGRWGTTPWLLFAGLMAGLCVGFYELIKASGRR